MHACNSVEALFMSVYMQCDWHVHSLAIGPGLADVFISFQGLHLGQSAGRVLIEVLLMQVSLESRTEMILTRTCSSLL